MHKILLAFTLLKTIKQLHEKPAALPMRDFPLANPEQKTHNSNGKNK